MNLFDNYEIESLMIGDYKICQSKGLYKFTSDSVLLSKFSSCPKNAVVGDLCSGSGIVGLHFFALNSQSVRAVHLFEIQSGLSQMSEKTIELNGLEKVFTVHNLPIQQIDGSFNQTFDLLLCNPPYKKKNTGGVGKEHIAICKHEIKVTFDEICSVSKRILKSGGRLVFCNATDRLFDCFNSLKQANLFPHRLVFIHGNLTDKPYLFMCEAYKGVEKQLVIDPPLINKMKNISGEV